MNCHLCPATSQDIDGNPTNDIKTCSLCSEGYCENHTSSIDDNFCSECYSFLSHEIKEEELVSENGVRHRNARHLVLTGNGWKSTMFTISKLKDEELTKWIDRYRRLKAEAHMILDHRSIVFDSLRMEELERRDARLRHVEGTLSVRNLNHSSMPRAKSPRPPKPTKSQSDVLFEQMQKAGFTLEMFQEFLKKHNPNTTDSNGSENI